MNATRIARIAGRILVVAAVVLLADRVAALEIWRHDFDLARLGPVVALAVPVYAITVALLAVAWMILLGALAPPAGVAIPWYLISQFGKYVPGNVAHLATRHVLFTRGGVSQTALVAAAATEAGLLVVGAAATAGALAPIRIASVVRDTLPQGAVTLVTLACAVLAAVAVAAAIALARAPDRREKLVAIGAALLIYVGFFIVGGTILSGLVAGLTSSAATVGNWPLIVAAAAAAWLCGFVVPGAPGGLGIREGVLTLLLSPLTGADTALLAALAFRAVTLLGDGIAALVGVALVNWAGPRRLAERN